MSHDLLINVHMCSKLKEMLSRLCEQTKQIMEKTKPHEVNTERIYCFVSFVKYWFILFHSILFYFSLSVSCFLELGTNKFHYTLYCVRLCTWQINMIWIWTYKTVSHTHTLMPASQSSVTSLSLSSSRFFWADATMTWTSVVRTFSAEAWTQQHCYSLDIYTHLLSIHQYITSTWGTHTCSYF